MSDAGWEDRGRETTSGGELPGERSETGADRQMLDFLAALDREAELDL
jgi:hypothetical protein